MEPTIVKRTDESKLDLARQASGWVVYGAMTNRVAVTKARFQHRQSENILKRE